MKVRANGIEIHYVVEGAGPWLTMSHSLTCDLRMWDEEARRLSGSFTVLRYDTRGHGASSAPPGPYSLDMMAQDLLALYQALGVRSSHFVGLSMGGMIGMTFALNYPGILRSLALCDTSSRYPPEAAAGRFEKIRIAQEHGMQAHVAPTLAVYFTEPFRRSQPEAVAKVAAMIANTPVEGFVGCTLANMKIDLTHRLGGIGLPAIVIVGEQDSGTPVPMSQAIHAAMPGSMLKVIASAAHLANIEQPDAFNAALREFLDGLQD